MEHINDDFLIEDQDHSPALWEGVDSGREPPPGAPHILPLTLSKSLAAAEATARQLQDLTPARPSTNQWDPRFILDLAIGVDALPEILERYGLTSDEFDILAQTQVFRRELAMAIRDARENGLPFAQKAKVQAESYLEVIDQLVYDASTPASTRLEAIRSMVRWGKLENTAGEKEGVNAQQININISF